MSTTAIAEPSLTNALDDRSLAEIDPAIHAVLENEKERQDETVLLHEKRLWLLSKRNM